MDPLIIPLIFKFLPYSPWIIFGAMILTGCNLPISEDLLILISGILASNFIPEKLWMLWLAIFIGAYIADIIAYWTGRLIGPKLLKNRWTSRLVTAERMKKVHSFYERWGLLSFMIGRFIPFGVRNCLFISAGMGTLGFKKFLITDGIAAFVSTTTGFCVSYALGKAFGRHFQVLFDYLNNFDIALICIGIGVTAAILGFVIYKRFKKKTRTRSSDELPIPIDLTPPNE